MTDLLTNTFFKTSTIADGNMSFRIGDTDSSFANRKSFLLGNGIAVTNHICMKCDHGEQITVVDWNTHTRHFRANTQDNMLPSEVLVTKEKGLVLMLLTADCLPVSFYDPITETIALAHFSRETIAKKLPLKTISFLQGKFLVDPKNLHMQVGPYIHTDSYSFPSDTHTIQTEILPYTNEIDGRIYVDLIAACNAQLTHAGVDLDKVTISKNNTCTSPNHFSHYASKTKNDPAGRLASVLMMY